MYLTNGVLNFIWTLISYMRNKHAGNFRHIQIFIVNEVLSYVIGINSIYRLLVDIRLYISMLSNSEIKLASVIRCDVYTSMLGCDVLYLQISNYYNDKREETLSTLNSAIKRNKSASLQNSLQ